ncbi:proton-transporting V-type ATPase complex assembly regulator TMEM9-like [Sycon ciliatum]|uniref:proton-transporting V-type ATPase complex assembly regulator TMEM9-like n=1 Tax=Sycon ciliatum TaxID=27933 RepID=UPI0020AE135F|eukprot:scpid69651/ scgid22352/ 
MASTSVLFGVLVTLLSLTLVAEASVDITKDFRCRCVCPKGLDQTKKRAVFIENEADPRQCECNNVVPNATIEFCLQCKCQVESINSWMIKSIIVLILISFAALIGVGIWQIAMGIYQRRRASVSVSAHDVILPGDEYSISSDERALTPVAEVEASQDFVLHNRDSGREGASGSSIQRFGRRVQDTMLGAQQEVQRQRDYVYNRHALLS